MTITEALIAIVIAAGVMMAAVEATRMAATRTAISLLEMEAVVRAEALLASAGVDFPLAPGRIGGTHGDDVIWTEQLGQAA